MSALWIIITGFIFGILIRYSKLNYYDTIVGLAVFKNFMVAKTILLVIGLGSLFLAYEMSSESLMPHVKPFYIGGVMVGGIVFGVGMALLGYCPGTLPISLGRGSLDALVGLIGGFAGGLLYSIVYPEMRNLLGHDFGEISILSLMGNQMTMAYWIVICIIALIFIAIAFWLDHLDRKLNDIKNYKWVITALGIIVMNLMLFYIYSGIRLIGASSAYPYLIDKLVGLTAIPYFEQVKSAGGWESLFLLGAFLAGLLVAIISGTFKLTLIYPTWAHYKGTSKPQRIFWAFVGGLLLIFGARYAGGCTSGHIISGGMQYAISSLVFACFTFIGFLGTGYLFYTLPNKTKN